MISAFVLREFGFRMKLPDADMQKVGKYRPGKHYNDRSTAMDKRGTSADV
jgi:hypothetical protein